MPNALKEFRGIQLSNDYSTDNWNVETLKEKRAALIKELRNMIDEAKHEKRALDNGLYDQVFAHVNSIKEELDTNRQSRGLMTDPGAGTAVNHIDKRRIDMPGENREVKYNEELRSGESFSSLPGREKEDKLSLGKYLRGIVTGDWSDADNERRAMSTLAGGTQYVIPKQLSDELIDLSRNESSIMRAGARTIPMTTRELVFARSNNDFEGHWKAENAEATSSEITFDDVRLELKMLMAFSTMSIELYEDAPNIDEVVKQSMSKALATELDRAALRGKGTAVEPLGLLNHEGINTLTMNGPITNFIPFSRGVQLIQERNGMPAAAIYSARTSGDLDRVVDSTGQPLTPPKSYESLNKFVSNQIPNNLGAEENASEVYIGDFSQAYVGIKDQIVIEAFRTGEGAFKSGQVNIRAYLRADVALAKPSHFTVIKGVVPTEDTENMFVEEAAPVE